MTEDIGLKGSQLNVCFFLEPPSLYEALTRADVLQICVSIFYIFYILAEVCFNQTAR